MVPPVDVAGAAVVIPASSKRLKLSRAGILRFKLGPMRENTTGLLQIKTAGRVRVGGKRKAVSFGTKAFQALTGQTVAVRLQLSRRTRALVRRLGRVKARAVITLHDQAGNATIETVTATLRR